MPAALANPFVQLVSALSEDRILGGAIRIEQPQSGYRTAIDPILLAASVCIRPGERILDLGCGVGTVALAIVARQKSLGSGLLSLLALDKDPVLLGLAQKNVEKNGFTDSIQLLRHDIADGVIADCAGGFDQIVSNPPYLQADAADASPDTLKAVSNVESTADLGMWIDFAWRMLKSRGTFTMIHRADRLDEILSHFTPRFGNIRLLPLWPKTGQVAKRILLAADKDSKAPLTLLPGQVLHQQNGSYTKEIDDVLQRMQPLALSPMKA